VSSPIVLAANAKAGIASIPDLAAIAKAKPLSYAVAARGSAAHLVAELLQHELGIAMQAVPYRGGAPAAVAIASGEVPLGFLDTGSILPMIGGGQVVALASARRRGWRCSRRAVLRPSASTGSIPKSPGSRCRWKRKGSCLPPASSLLTAARAKCAASSKRTTRDGVN
jgi:hypothetical protein